MLAIQVLTSCTNISLALSLSSNDPYLYLTQIMAKPIYLTWKYFLNRLSVIYMDLSVSSSSWQILNSQVWHFYASKPSLLYKMY